MKSCLETAFNEFQQWRRSHKIACSQRSFAPRHLLKAVHGYYLTTKAYNARIVMLWLAEKCQQVALNSCANSPIHLHATALQLCYWFWKLFFFSSKSYALIHIPNTTKVSNTPMINPAAQLIFLAVVYLRTAFSRWFSGNEAAKRYLQLPWHYHRCD